MTDEFKKEIKKDLVDVKEVKKEPVEVKETKKKVVKKEEVKPVVENKGYYVCSRLSHPTELKLKGKSFMLAPRGKTFIDKAEDLGTLPNGIYVRKIN